MFVFATKESYIVGRRNGESHNWKYNPHPKCLSSLVVIIWPQQLYSIKTPTDKATQTRFILFCN